MEDLVQKYRKCIPTAELTNAFKVYYNTKDQKIREQIIYRYMPMVKKMVSNFNIVTHDEEDLFQTAYEILIECVDRYNPYCKTHFYIILRQGISKISRMYGTNREKNISLSDIEIYSNDDLEFSIENKLTNDNLLNMIREILDEYPNKTTTNIFRRLYGIDSKIMKPLEICEELNVTPQRVSQVRSIVLLHLFFKLNEDYKYYPSEEIIKFIKDISSYWLSQLPKGTLNALKELDLSELNYLAIYDSCDSIENSHELVKKK